MKTKLSSVKVLLFGLAVSGLIAVIFGLVSLRSKIAEIGDGAVIGAVWFVGAIELDFQSFQIAVSNYLLDNTTAQDVNLQFDILWSRVSGASQGEVAARIEDFGADATLLDQIMAVLRQHETTVLGIDTASPDTVRLLLTDLAGLNDQIHKLNLDVLQASSLETQNWRDALLDISATNVVLRIIIISTVLILMIMFWLESVSANRQLEIKNRLLVAAEAANLAKTQFMSVVNHELRTPLTSIKGSVSLMSAGAFGPLPEKLQQPIEIAKRNCIKLEALITDLLDVERFSKGDMEYRFERIDLPAFLQEQVETNAPFATTFDVALVADPAMPELAVSGDPQRLGQAVSNLISNAAKFSSAGDEVIVGLERVDDRAVVSVKDTGKGIPEAAREHIFDQFQQVDSSDVRERGGAGLGLAIVKSIVEAHGGKVVFDTVVGRGTTFRFDLPLAE